jgi:predicted lipid-binding transport protein (Tim44 family)
MKIKKMKSLFIGYLLAFAFIGLGYFIITDFETLLAQTIGYSNIILFSGLILWSAFRLLKTSRKSN